MTISTRLGITFAIIAIIIATLAANAILEIALIKLSYAQVVPAPSPMCKPADTHINGTESRVCGIPKTPSLSSSAATNSTTSTAGRTTTPQSLENTTIPQGAIPGLLP